MKNQGWRVRIAPAAIHLDATGGELPTRDEDWVIVQVTADEVRLDDALTLRLTTMLGTDDIYEFDLPIAKAPD